MTDAVRNYLEAQSWTQFVERNERRAKAMGIAEEDVVRLITEYRADRSNLVLARNSIGSRKTYPKAESGWAKLRERFSPQCTSA